MKKDPTGKTWADNYKDPRWQKKRLEIMERDGFKCRGCGADDKTLNVHHSYYDKGKMPWEYGNNTLVTFCGECHEKRHNNQKDILRQMGRLPNDTFFALYYLMVIDSPEKLLQAINDGLLNRGHVELDILAKMVSVLSDAYEAGMEDGE